MILFALDSSGKTAGVCVVKDGNILFEKTLNEGLTHSQTLLVLVQQACTACALRPADIDMWAVTNGPGSFTGLRIGLALVKGMALPHNTPVVPVSTLEAAAVGSGLQGTVVAALDARRGEVYWAAFSCGAQGCTRLVPDTAGPVGDIAQILSMEQTPLFFVGDGAGLCYNVYNYAKPGLPPLPSGPLPIARGAALLAARQPAKARPPAQLQPCYLRLSQAERERRAAQSPKEFV